jgi:serine/threonine-protein phosphatase 2B catalytic subunit
MPIAALVEDRILAIHGGISPSIVKDGLQGIARIDRFCEVNTSQVFTDLLWSDPADEKKYGTIDFTFKPNVQRKCSNSYGKQSINEFLESNDLLCIVRAHEVKMEGYEMYEWNGKEEFPPIITIFSAPNYCDIYNNKGALFFYENE